MFDPSKLIDPDPGVFGEDILNNVMAISLSSDARHIAMGCENGAIRVSRGLYGAM